jgi:hypothetical protein
MGNNEPTTCAPDDAYTCIVGTGNFSSYGDCPITAHNGEAEVELDDGFDDYVSGELSVRVNELGLCLSAGCVGHPSGLCGGGELEQLVLATATLGLAELETLPTAVGWSSHLASFGGGEVGPSVTANITEMTDATTSFFDGELRNSWDGIIWSGSAPWAPPIDGTEVSYPIDLSGAGSVSVTVYLDCVYCDVTEGPQSLELELGAGACDLP